MAQPLPMLGFFALLTKEQQEAIASGKANDALEAIDNSPLGDPKCLIKEKDNENI